MNQLKFIYNSPFKDSLSQSIHTCFPKIAGCFRDAFIFMFKAIKKGLARVYSFKIPRESGCKPVTDIINEKCDLIRPSDPKDKVKIPVTGVGANLFQTQLEKLLKAE